MGKRIVLFLACMSVTCSLLAQRPKVGVVLCGGGAKGSAHVGVLKYLEENNIPIDYIAGTSMGAIIGGLYAIGYSADDLDKMIKSQDWNFVMSGNMIRKDISYENKTIDDRLIVKVPFSMDIVKGISSGSALPVAPMGFIGDQNITNLFSKYTVGYQDSLDFNKMPIPYACVAVDLNTQEEVVIHSGVLAKAMRASMAIPGVFSPVKSGSHMFVDGGVKNNFPVDVVRQMGADIVIGVLLGYEDEVEPRTFSSPMDIAGSMLEIITRGKVSEGVSNTDILIAPSVKGFNTMSFDTKSLTTLIQNGYDAAVRKKDEIEGLRKLLGNYDSRKKSVATYEKVIMPDDSLHIGSITVKGIGLDEGLWLLRGSKIHSGESVTINYINDVINELYATGSYSSINYYLTGQQDPFNLELEFIPAQNNQLGLGVRFDSQEAASILLDLRFKHKRLYGSKFSVDGKLHYNYYINLTYSYVFKRKFEIDLATGVNNHDIDIQDWNKAMKKIAYHNMYAKANLATSKLRIAKINCGARLDAFTYDYGFDNNFHSEDYSSDFGKKFFPSAYFITDIDNLDNSTCPNKGLAMHFSSGLYFPFFYNDMNTFFVQELSIKGAFTPWPYMTLLPFVEGRAVFGKNPPVIFANALGGYERGKYMAQQLPFYGIDPFSLADRLLVVGGMDLRVNIGKSHHVFLGGNVAFSGSDIKELFLDNNMWGVRLGYVMDFVAGPISFNLDYSNYSKKLGYYLSIGYTF